MSYFTWKLELVSNVSWIIVASKFVKPEIICKLKDNHPSLAKLDISLENEKSDKSLAIGNITNVRFAEGDVSQNDVDNFFDAARELFETTCTYWIKWLPLDDPLYKGSRLVGKEINKNTIFQV